MKDCLILLPGFDGDGVFTFKKLVPRLESKYRVLVINYPYLGKIDRSYTLDELVEHVSSEIARHKIKRFRLVGFSMGGFVGSAFIKKYPTNIDQFILVSSSTKPLTNNGLRFISRLAYYVLKVPILAKLFTKFYLSPKTANWTKNFPIPKMGPDFPIEEGYPVYGTLANVTFEILNKFKNLTEFNRNKQHKMAILFDDDNSFPTKLYKPFLEQNDFEVITYKTGGHAESKDYWEKVGENF